MKWWQAAKSNPLFKLTVWLAVVVIALDQATKLWIVHGLRLPERPFRHLDLSPIFDLTYVENTGVSFGLFAGGIVSRIALTLLALIVAGFVLHWSGRLHRKWAAVGAGLIVGGALGNAIDRTLYGYVVDFLDFSALGFPWRFNVADSAINIGVAFLAYDAFFVSPKAAGSSGAAQTSAHLSSDEARERDQDGAFRDEEPHPIRPEDQNSRSSE